MPQSDTKATTFDFGKIDWDEYESHRPPYPSSLFDVIFQHHRNHGGQWNTALDVGAGGGIVTKVLLDHFKHVVCSDAAPGYVDQAAQRFSEEKSDGRVSFVQRKFDEFQVISDFPQGQPVDLVTAGTCIHFGDAANIMQQLGQLVVSGGTVSAFSYGAMPILPVDDPAGPLVYKIKDTVIRWIHENVTPLDNHAATGTNQARYNNVAFDPAVWTDVRRITSLPNELMWPQWINAATSRVQADVEQVEVVEDDFLARTVTYDFFPEYFRNLAPGFDISDLIKRDLQELRQALDGRQVLVKWPLMFLLATKR